MPCKKRLQLPSKCTPASRRILGSLTIKDLAQAAAECVPCSQTSCTIPKSGQFANDRDDGISGESRVECTSHHQESSETRPQTLRQTKSCVSTCKEVSAMFDEIRECRHTIGALAKEAQNLITAAAGVLDGSVFDEPIQSKQDFKRFGEISKTGSRISCGQKPCKSSERLRACVSCDNTAKKRGNKDYEAIIAASKKSNQKIYAKRSSHKDPVCKTAVEHRHTSQSKMLQQNKANREKEIKGNAAENKITVDDCACEKKNSSKKKSGTDVSCECVAPKNVDKKMKTKNRKANRKNKGTSCECKVQRDVNKSRSDSSLRKQIKGGEKPNSKNSRQEKNTLKKIDSQKSHQKKSGVKRKKKLSCLGKIWNKICDKKISCDCSPKVDDCGCYEDKGHKKKVKRKKSSVIKIGNKSNDKKISCDCSPKVDDCGCYEDKGHKKKVNRKKSSVIKIGNKSNDKKVSCECTPKVDNSNCDVEIEKQMTKSDKPTSCDCDEDVIKKNEQNSYLNKAKSIICCNKKSSNKLIDKITCDCGSTENMNTQKAKSESATSCGCDEDVIKKNSYLNKAKSIICCNKKSSNKLIDKITCDCGSGEEMKKQKTNSDSATSCGCDEDVNKQNSYLKKAKSIICYHKKSRNKLIDKITCDCGSGEEMKKQKTNSDSATSCGCDEDVNKQNEQNSYLEKAKSILCYNKKSSNKLIDKITCDCGSNEEIKKQNAKSDQATFCDCEPKADDCGNAEDMDTHKAKLDKVTSDRKPIVADCGCDEEMEKRNAKSDKATFCDCEPNIDSCGYEEDMEKQNAKSYKDFGCDCVEDSENGPQATSQKLTSDSSDNNVAPRVLTSIIYTGQQKEIKEKTSESVAAATTCKCCFPPAYSQFFKCTGHISGNCHCDKND